MSGLPRRPSAIAAVLAVALGACATGRLKPGFRPEGEVVDAEGWTPLGSDDLLALKRRSLLEAQKKAVEQVVGVFISGKTRVSQAAEVDENILGKVEGFVRRYEVLSEKREDGFYKTRVRALVLYKKVGDELKRLGVGAETVPGNPRLSVLVAEAGAPAGASPAGGAVRRALMARGFTVVERSTSPFSGADVAVWGEAEVHPIEGVPLAGFRSFRARVSLEAVKPGSLEVLARQTQEASALDPSAEIAASKAMESAGQLAGEELSSQLVKGLRSNVGMTLLVLGAKDLTEARSIADDLRLQPEVSSVSLSEFRAEGVQFSVSTEGVAGDEFAAMLLRMSKHPFRVSSVTPYAVEVRLPK